MDSYTDVSTQCCGRGHTFCGMSFGNGCGLYTNPDYPDMNAPSWGSWGSDPALSYPTPAAPVTQPANMSCFSIEEGVPEQQFPVAMVHVPWWQWQTACVPERGLVQETILLDLDLQLNYRRRGR